MIIRNAICRIARRDPLTDHSMGAIQGALRPTQTGGEMTPSKLGRTIGIASRR